MRGEFGYWFSTATISPAEANLNYKKEEAAHQIDMFCHWRYVIDNIFGEIKSLSALGATHIDKRLDEKGVEYACTAEDAAYGTFELKNGIICQFNSSWAVRVRRDDLLTLQVDGTKGTAVAGLRDCYVQGEAMTPKPIWNPDIASPIDYYEDWAKLPVRDVADNAFKVQWEKFSSMSPRTFPPLGPLAGAKGVQLAELGLESWKTRRWGICRPLRPKSAVAGSGRGGGLAVHPPRGPRRPSLSAHFS